MEVIKRRRDARPTPHELSVGQTGVANGPVVHENPEVQFRHRDPH